MEHVPFPLTLIALLSAAPAACAPVTAQDIARMNAKLALAQRYIASNWKTFFEKQGDAFQLPRLIPYRTSTRSGCGLLGANNAFFCGKDNTIYYDEVFLTALMKESGGVYHTDGDYAPITALAHEFGHGVRFWQDNALRKKAATPACTKCGNLGFIQEAARMAASMQLQVEADWGTQYVREAQADCYAGAVTKTFQENRQLEPGDREEAEYMLGWAGDKPIVTRWNSPGLREYLYSHGEGRDRIKHFRAGLTGGVSACLKPSDLIQGDAGLHPDKSRPERPPYPPVPYPSRKFR